MHWIATWLIVFVPFPLAASCGSDLVFTVRLLDYVDVPTDTLREAEGQASWIFQHARIRIEWANFKVKSERRVPAWTPAEPEVLINVLPDEVRRDFGISQHTLACATVPGDSTNDDLFPTNAYVCFPCITALADKWAGLSNDKPLQSAALGGVLAHELGHLLGIGRHSALGLMRVRWSTEELALALKGQLRFWPDERRKIRAYLTRRILLAAHANLRTQAALGDLRVDQQKQR